MRISFTKRSGNKKTGPIPVTISERATCPSTCALKNAGCYAENFPLGQHWRQVSESGPALESVLPQIAALPAGQLWRHNQAGDLPGRGTRINRRQLLALARASEGKRGFMYTHKPATKVNLAAIHRAHSASFVINLSANNPTHADELARHGLPVVTVLSADVSGPVRLETPQGRQIVVCPATYRNDVTCATCALCAIPDRTAIIGFPAHGTRARLASEVTLSAEVP